MRGGNEARAGTTRRRRGGGPTRLQRALLASRDPREAAEAVVGYCLELGYPLPSVYLERGGHLRCLAHRGYWQVFDGIPPGAGIVGQTHAAGRAVLVVTEEAEGYIEAAAEVRSGVCVPVLLGGRSVGVLNVESPELLDDADLSVLEAVAQEFARRLGELGGPLLETPAEELARHASRLACLSRREEIAAQTLDAAMALSGMGSAALLVLDEGEYVALALRGNLAPAILALQGPALEQLARFVAVAASSYAAGDEPEERLPSHVLRPAGVQSLVVLALAAERVHQGLLVVADTRARPGISTALPLLELLATTAGSALHAAGASEALRASERRLAHQVRHDQLTGLANRSFLLEALDELLVSGPAERVAVLFVDLDGFKEVNDQHGHGAGDRLLVAVAGRLHAARRESDLVARLGGDEFVVVCRDLEDARDAVEVARRLVDGLGGPYLLEEASVRVSASVGIAMGTPGCSGTTLLARADTAMYAAKAGGRGGWSMAAPDDERAAPVSWRRPPTGAGGADAEGEDAA
ncbi:MAG: diguanylate cyclase [Actinomycetota bacterium]|nr:diguanylate cyclase [Actinomycetota bacterium]